MVDLDIRNILFLFLGSDWLLILLIKQDMIYENPILKGF